MSTERVTQNGGFGYGPFEFLPMGDDVIITEENESGQAVHQILVPREAMVAYIAHVTAAALAKGAA